MKKLGEMQLCTAYCLKSIIIKQLSHYVILFGFRKGKSEKFSYHFRAISVFWSIYSIQVTEKLNLLFLWTVVGGRVGYQAWQDFCCIWLELVCHECLGQSGRYLDKLQLRAVSVPQEINLSYYGRQELCMGTPIWGQRFWMVILKVGI